LIKLLSFLIFLLCGLGSGFAQNIGIGGGINYGGPIPTETIDSTSGKPLIGFTAGISYSIPLSERFSFQPQLYYSYRGMDYSQSYTRDTLFTVIINGNSGEVPSFYTAYIDGSMRLHYIDIPLLVTYRILKFQLMFGPYISVLLGGRDSGDVRVVIGSGGFFDDYTEAYSNYAVIRKLEQGFMVGSTAPIYKNLSIEIKASRSFTTLYNLDKIVDRGQGSVKMYNTYVQLGLVYTLTRD
jgi:hypothetical protein